MRTLVCLVSLPLLLWTASAAAQDGLSPSPATPRAAPLPAQQAQVPLEVQIVIARYQGEKRISSMPYVLAVNANAPPTQLNMGAEVPVPAAVFPTSDKEPSPVRSFNYRSVGTSIEVNATQSVTAGAFDLTLNVDESSVGNKSETSVNAPASNEIPIFRTFRSRTRLTLRDGQTRQYTAATDRVSGETTRLEVTVRVVK